VIDLHLHTTASDGRSTPDALVRSAVAAGITTLAVTDHDTMAAAAEVHAAARDAGLGFVPGIEITAVHHGRDVHVLGYFLDAADRDLDTFLTAQRADRRRRLVEMGAKLADLGVGVDVDAILTRDPRGGGRAVGRPQLAAALVAAGHATGIADAFDRFLATGRPAFVPRLGAPPAEVIAIIRRAGGLASLAHPGKMDVDPIIPALAAAGLDAIEVWHPDHDAGAVTKYRAMAAVLGVGETGGSDYHGPGAGRVDRLGEVGLTDEAFARLVARRAGPAS
jgi:3',5'-nucleoside bisphosphate phosphatase